MVIYRQKVQASNLIQMKVEMTVTLRYHLCEEYDLHMQYIVSFLVVLGTNSDKAIDRNRKISKFL